MISIRAGANQGSAEHFGSNIQGFIVLKDRIIYTNLETMLGPINVPWMGDVQGTLIHKSRYCYSEDVIVRLLERRRYHAVDCINYIA